MIKMIATGVVGLLIGAVTVGALTAQQDGAELRVIARPLEDGRTEFAIRDANGEQHLPASRFLPTRAEVERRGWVGRWLPSSPVTISSPTPAVPSPEADGADSGGQLPEIVLWARRFAEQFQEHGLSTIQAADEASAQVDQCRGSVSAMRERPEPASATFARDLDRWCQSRADFNASLRAFGVAAQSYGDGLQTAETPSGVARHSNVFIAALERLQAAGHDCEVAEYSFARAARSYARSDVSSRATEYGNALAEFATGQGENCAGIGRLATGFSGTVGEIRDLVAGG